LPEKYIENAEEKLQIMIKRVESAKKRQNP